ncbi:MAG TPA: hypothetical protein VGQ12_07615 [Candidatus Angelobacter sp.]|jgi:hypothetical protein|nr:hypothetical protein [Candidatus Angelobacter sp.]
MKNVFQTTFGVPTGNCFGACVASVLELEEIPDIDPAIPDEEEWRQRWHKFFASIGYEWTCTTYDEQNWGPWPKGYSVAHVLLAPGILHALVMHDGVPIHDPLPGSPFLKLPPTEQRKHTIEGYSRFERIEATANGTS